MKINWDKEDCIQYIVNNVEKFTQKEINLFEISLKLFETSQNQISNNIALDNMQFIIQSLHERGFYEEFKNNFSSPIRNYWKERCLAAEKYIEESPCDPDIYLEQYKAYENWLNLKNEK